MLFHSNKKESYSSLDKINNAWKGASEEMYKAQANNQKESKNEPKGKNQKNDKDKPGKDDVQDVDFEEVSKIARAVTPVPGGVGPMTIACLLQNTVDCFKRSFEKT